MSVDHPGCTPASDLPPPHQRIEWGLLPEETLDALIEFVSALVSACSLYGEMCMACAARHLMPPEEVSGSPRRPRLRRANNYLAKFRAIAPIA